MKVSVLFHSAAVETPVELVGRRALVGLSRMKCPICFAIARNTSISASVTSASEEGYVVSCQSDRGSVLLVYITSSVINSAKYSVILSVLDPRKCEYLKDYSLDFEHAYMTTYLAS